MKKLYQADIDNLLIGDSWLATGGGFPMEKAKQIFLKILKKGPVFLKNLNEFEDWEYLCVGSGVGSVKHTDTNIIRDSTKAMQILEKITGQKIKGIISGEIGLECLAAETASKLKISLVDTDMKGGRAAPEPSINMFNLKNKSVLPAVAINTDGDISVLKKVKDPQKMEIFLRHFANMAAGTFVAWCPRQAAVFKEYLIPETVSKSIDIGKMIRKGNSTEKILDRLVGKVFFRGLIKKITIEKNEGFLIQKVTIVNNHQKAEIWTRNENLVLAIDNITTVTCPDLITVLDPRTNLGIHNSKLKIGQKVIIIAIPHNKRWHSKRGHKLFGPKHFGFPFSVKRA